jgi:uncharacterized protein
MVTMPAIALYFLISAAVVACWCTGDQRKLIALPIMLVCAGLGFGLLDLTGLLFLSVCAGLIYVMSLDPKNNPGYIYATLPLALAGAVIIFSIMSGHHWFPGVHNLKLLDAVKFSENSLPFSMYLNIDKAFLGLLLLIFVIRPHESRVLEFDWIRVGVIVLMALMALMIPLTLASGYVEFDPKIPPETWIWMINNLVIVCMAEEAFFRGLIQAQLSRKIGWYAILPAAIIFGLAHHNGGPAYGALATVAGLFYGAAYHQTRRIEASILVHFLFNSAHFLLFSYPALARPG